jgi:hypothetical protein
VDEAVPELRAFVPDPGERAAVEAILQGAVQRAFPSDASLRQQVLENVARNLADKLALPPQDGHAFTLSSTALVRQVFGYEIFKLQTFLSSGVFPKRYFGYFDEAWDTADRERIFKAVVHQAVAVLNAQGATHISDAEVAVTFLAEGGAVLLREKQGSLDHIHPVLDIGLDDVALGFARHPAWVHALDDALGTGLHEIVASDGDGARLTRFMNFREAIAGTALMYADEKGLAAHKLAEQGRSMEGLSLDAQFVAGSLVYNSGLLFSSTSRAHIEHFTTGAELFAVSTQNAKTRPLLPVLAPADALASMRAGNDYPVQMTSWSGMYHVLQRYGAFRALRLFTDVFDEHGMFQHVP